MKRIFNISVFHMIILLVTLGSSLFIMTAYLYHPLRFGTFNQHFLPAKMFGVPEELAEKGIKPLYVEPKECGWDGQFYYYIANDVLGLKDTSKHIDADAYRYQRIGLPLLAKVLSLVVLRDWVSPVIYYLTSLLLILGAAVTGASFFKEKGVLPYWILIWSLGVGTQLTLMNGLPDAAADSLLIMALVALMRRHYGWYAVAASLAALSREAYVLVAMTIFLTHFCSKFLPINSLSLLNIKKCCLETLLDRTMWFLFLPVLIFTLWQGYIHFHFGSPSAQASGILGLPFQNIWHYFYSGWQQQHPLLGPGPIGRIEAIGILLFVVLLSSCLVRLIGLLKWGSSRDSSGVGIAIGFVCLIGMYYCFGPTVMQHYTGYMKAANIFYFLFFFITALDKRSVFKSWLYVIAIGFVIYSAYFFDRHLLEERVLTPPYHPHSKSGMYSS